MKNRVLFVAGSVVVGFSVLLASGNARTLAPVADPERNSSALTSWYWYHDVSPAFLSNNIKSKGLRMIDLKANSPSTFSAVLVKNSGVYARTWWWFYGLTAGGLSAKISSLNARIIDLEAYTTSAGLRFAAVLVKNAGDSAKTWWWYYGQTVPNISAKLTQNGARLIDVDAYQSSGSTRYAAVMIKNSGIDATAWWWYVGATPSTITQKLSDNKARLIGIEPDGSGKFDVIMVKAAGEYWWWYYGLSAEDLSGFISQNGARLIDLEPYTSGGSRKYAAVMINNLDAESTRVRQSLLDGWTGGSFGFYMKKVGGNVSVALNSETKFEPASAIKALIAVYSMKQIQNGADSLRSSVDYYTKPADPDNKDVCPDPAWESNAALKVTTTVRDALTRMLQPSDNRTTRTLTLRYGQSNINGFASNTVGMLNTNLAQIIGCGFDNNLRNDLTLVDAGKLYEGVSNGTLLNATHRGYLFDGTDVSPAQSILLKAGGSYYTPVVQDEAAKLGKTAVVNQFVQNMVFHWKGGGYTILLADPKTYRAILTEAGIVTLPFKSGGTIVATDFVYGRWIDLRVNCTAQGQNETQAQFYARCNRAKKLADTTSTANYEIFRAQIKAALQTW